MNLYKVDFPSILVSHNNVESLRDFIYDEVSSSMFYSDLTSFECKEVNSKNQLESFEDGYIPYGITPDNMTAQEVLNAVEILNSLKDNEIEVLKQLLKIE